jgi:predicted hydrocarbon binding protein
MQEHSFKLGRFIVEPGKDIFGLHIHLNRSYTTLQKIRKLIEGEGFSYINERICVEADEMEAFIVLENKDGDMDSLLTKLDRLLRRRGKVEVVDPIVRGILVDLPHFPIKEGERRFILLSMEVLRGLRRNIKLSFGGWVIDALMYHAGLESGRAAVKKYYSSFIKHDFKFAMNVFYGALHAFGYARTELEFDLMREDRCVLKLYENWECEIERPAKNPQGHFIRGLIKGALEEAVLRNVDVEEKTCIAMGDECCTFVVSLK